MASLFKSQLHIFAPQFEISTSPSFSPRRFRSPNSSRSRFHYPADTSLHAKNNFAPKNLNSKVSNSALHSNLASKIPLSLKCSPFFSNEIFVSNHSFVNKNVSKNGSRIYTVCALQDEISEKFQKNKNLIVKSLFKVLVFRILPVIAMTLLFSSTKPFAASAHSSSAISTSHIQVTSGEALKTSELINSAWTGLAAGWLHTLSGPDHLAALAPLSIGRTRLQSAAVGALWGCGHDAGQILFGLIFLLLKDKLHLDLLRTWGSRVVGITLLIIGGMGIREARHTPIQCQPDDESCLSQPGAVAIEVNRGGFGLTTFVTGIVHGLQPDALLVILPALALPSKLAGAAFLGMFLLGTIVAMGTYTAFIGTCSQALHERVPGLTQKLSLIASSIALAVGCFIILGDVTGRKLF